MADAFEIGLATLQYWITHAADPRQAEAAIPREWHELIRQAAWLTVGQKQQTGWPQLKDSPLQSVFNRVQPKPGHQSSPAFIHPNPLRLDKAVLFPTPEAAKLSSGAGLIQSLLETLTTIKQQNMPSQTQLEHLFYVLQEHAWCLPSPLEAVSIFDFARTHAAIAAIQAVQPGDVFLLGGDISGVQQFIYSLSSDGATKQLRGRSFYLQLLGEAIPQMIAQRAGLPLTNILYSGGGRFYLVVPQSFEQEIDELRQEISSILLQRHAGELYVALGGASYSGDQESWQRVNDAINADKQRRFASLDADTLINSLFSPQPPIWSSDTEGTSDDILSKSLEKLGRDLHNKPYLFVRPRRSPRNVTTGGHYQPTQWFNVLRDFEMQIWPLEVRQWHVRSGRLLQMRDLSTNEASQSNFAPEIAHGSRYMVNVAPILEHDVERTVGGELETYRAGNVMPFNLMAERSQGVKRLGVLRMDVDDLGELFGHRLKRGAGLASLAYTAALSAALSRFFEGWVGELCRLINQKNQGAGAVYAIYSGGDDLFIVGSWHLLPQLAADIRNDFVRYTTGLKDIPANFSPPITISAGITLHTPKFPLYQAADVAATALDQAKSHTRESGSAKDALAFLGQTIGWEHYAELDKTYTQLCKLIEQQNVPRGILMTIQDMYNRYSDGLKQHRTRDGRPQFAFGPWVWQGKYRLVRLAGRSSNATIMAEVKALADKLTTDINTRFIERAGLAARWAQLSLRERKDAQ